MLLHLLVKKTYKTCRTLDKESKSHVLRKVKKKIQNNSYQNKLLEKRKTPLKFLIKYLIIRKNRTVKWRL